MDEIWNKVSKGRTDVEKLDILREIKSGMSWGTREHGILQLTQTELFLLKKIDELEER